MRRLGIVAVGLALLFGIGCASDNTPHTDLPPAGSPPPATSVPPTDVQFSKEQILTAWKAQMVQNMMAASREELAKLSPEEREAYRLQVEKPAPFEYSLTPEERAAMAERMRVGWDALEEVLGTLKGMNAEQRAQYIKDLIAGSGADIPPELRQTFVSQLPTIADWPQSQIEAYMAALRAVTPEELMGVVIEATNETLAEIDAEIRQPIFPTMVAVTTTPGPTHCDQLKEEYLTTQDSVLARLMYQVLQADCPEVLESIPAP